MYQSFVSPAPSGPRNSGAFNFSISKALLKALHCGATFVVKALQKPPPPEDDNMKTNDRNHLNKFSSPFPLWFHMNFGFSWPRCFREAFEHTHKHKHARLARRRDPSASNKLYMPLYSCTPGLAESCSR